MNRITQSFAALAVLSASANAAVTTIDATGWTNDIVVDNRGGSYDTTVDGTMDNGPGSFDNWTFAEEGTYPTGGENTPTLVTGPKEGTHTTASGSTFVFQSFDSANALLLPGSTAGLLTLAAPGMYSTISLVGAVSGGPTTASVVINFSDLTSATFTITETGMTRDWFNTDAPGELAYAVGARVANRGEDAHTNLHYQENSAISLKESLLALSAGDQAKMITSIEVTNTGGGRLAVMGLSGEAVPEPSVLGLLGVCGLMGLVRRRRA